MNASKAKRRWIKWCRYVAKTGSRTGSYGTAGIHWGQAKAHEDVMTAGRAYPQGVRRVWFPYWGTR